MYLLVCNSLFQVDSLTVGLIYAGPFVLTLGLVSGGIERLNVMWIPLYAWCF